MFLRFSSNYLIESDDLFKLIINHKLIISSNEFSLLEKYSAFLSHFNRFENKFQSFFFSVFILKNLKTYSSNKPDILI